MKRDTLMIWKKIVHGDKLPTHSYPFLAIFEDVICYMQYDKSIDRYFYTYFPNSEAYGTITDEDFKDISWILEIKSPE